MSFFAEGYESSKFFFISPEDSREIVENSGELESFEILVLAMP